MKKLLVIAAVAVVAAFVFTSCEKDNPKPTTGTASYQYGMTHLEGDPETALEIFDIYKEELNKALPSAKVSGSIYTLDNVNFKDTDAKVLNACSTAANRVNSEVEIASGNKFTMNISASHEGSDYNDRLYSHTFSK